MPTKTPSPAKQVEGFISKFDPAVAKLARSARRAMRKRFPTAVELVYDNYNALAMGFGSTERTSDVIISVAVYASGVNLYFVYGRSLPDPRKLLQGAGTQGAFIRFTDLAVLDDPQLMLFLRLRRNSRSHPFRLQAWLHHCEIDLGKTTTAASAKA
jgi:hypothetical protein